MIAFFKWSHAFLVYSGQPLAWRKASTVSSALLVWMGSNGLGSEEGDDIVLVIAEVLPNMKGRI